MGAKVPGRRLLALQASSALASCGVGLESDAGIRAIVKAAFVARLPREALPAIMGRAAIGGLPDRGQGICRGWSWGLGRRWNSAASPDKRPPQVTGKGSSGTIFGCFAACFFGVPMVDYRGWPTRTSAGSLNTGPQPGLPPLTCSNWLTHSESLRCNIVLSCR
jgi:hypothetical protein